MKLRFEQLAGHLQGEMKPVYLVSGDEPLLLLEAADQIRQAARRRGCDEREVHFAEPGFDWTRLLVSSQSLSLFASRRLLELRLTNKLPQAGAAVLEQCLAAPSSDDTLLITAPRLDAEATRSRWHQAIDQQGVVVQIWPIEPRQMPQFLRQRLSRAGLEVTADALELLAQRVEGNLLAAIQEISKLSLLHSGRGAVTVDDILDEVGDSARYELHLLAERALQGDTQAALRTLDGLLAEGVEPPLLLWSLHRELTTLVLLHGRMAQGTAAAQAIDQHRPSIPQRRQPPLRQALQRLDRRWIERLLQQAALIDRAIKGAESIDIGSAFIDLVVGLSAPHHARLLLDTPLAH